MAKKNDQFEIRGVNHLALVCKDMAETVKFYRDILGMPLTKTLDLPNDMGQHFFFDMGGGNSLAFFWFKGAPEAQPGYAAAGHLPTQGSIVSAHGSMNHIAFDVPAEKFDDYVQRLKDKGIAVSRILNHDNSPSGSAADVTDDVWVRSVYFFDPDGICLEFASWVGKPFTEDDVAHAPMTASGVRDEQVIVPLAKRKAAAVPAE